MHSGLPHLKKIDTVICLTGWLKTNLAFAEKLGNVLGKVWTFLLMMHPVWLCRQETEFLTSLLAI